MYGLAVEDDTTGGGRPDRLARAAGRALLVRQPGYRRRLPLQADGWRRVVDLYLFDGPSAVAAALASAAWAAFTAAHPACRAAPALLVSECPWGGPVVLLRTAPGPTRDGQACWRDHLAHAEPEAILW